METCTPDSVDYAALDRLSDEIAQLSAHVDAAVLADPDAPGQSVLEDGVRVSAETSRRRLACDASRVVMQHGRDGRVVEVAARTRTDTFWTLLIRGIVRRRAA